MSETIRMISADSHVTIPTDQFHAHLSSDLREKVRAAEAAYVESNLRAKPQKAKQAQAATQASPTGLPNMGAGAPWPAAGRAGGHDPHERLKDMDIDGIEAEILYVGSGGASFAALDAKQRLEATRASVSWRSSGRPSIPKG